MDVASQIKKDYGEINFDNPVITFRYQRIDIETTSTVGYLNMVILLLIPVLFLILKGINLLEYILASVAFLFLIFRFSSSLNKVEIDFFYKRIRIKNKFPWLDHIRKLLKRPATFFFHDIAGIYTTKGVYYGRNQVRDFLVIKLVSHRTIRPAHFKDERDAEKLARLLQKHIVGQPELNN